MMIPPSAHKSSARICAAFLIVAMAIGLVGCDSKTVNTAVQPKLVVVIMVDQFRYDFLERFNKYFGSGGFRRLIDNGAFFTNANYIYVPTFTAPGHAAVFTGSVPAQNGIVGNNYFDRTAANGVGANKVMVSDDKATIIASWGKPNTRTPTPASPRILIGTTIGDQMRLSNNYKSKVVSLSLKDRAAILPGGKEANGAYWYDQASGTMISSDYYFNDLPKWVNSFNARRVPDQSFGKVWDHALGPEAYVTTESQVPDIKGSPLYTRNLGHFPYKIDGGEGKPGEKFYNEFQYTPYASDYLAEFARAAIEGESLGTDNYPDLLAISFSTPDLVGHSYGPDSEEVEDIYIQLDRTIADLLNYIDQKVGLSNTVIAMTGDHGVAPVPELLKLKNIDAEVIDPNRCRAAVIAALNQRYPESVPPSNPVQPANNPGPNTQPPDPKTRGWILDLVNDQLYFNKELITLVKADESEVERVAGEALLTVPGIARYFTRTQIVQGQVPQGKLGMQITNGFNPSRSGDVWLITKPFHFVAEGPIATTHGGPYNYDTHVPIILFGPGIKPNRYYTECSPSDITPTIAALIGVEPPATRVGRVLAEALGPQ